MTIRRQIAVTACTILVAVTFVVVAMWSWLGPTTVAVRRSPDDRHKAVLRRFQGIDVNFQLVVDGEKVFWSADFAPVPLDFREGVAWDRSGKRVIVTIADERIFGYDAETRAALTNGELLDVELPPFSEFGFEGKAPRAAASREEGLPNNEMLRTRPAQATEPRR
jgi:hypothetical protein